MYPPLEAPTPIASYAGAAPGRPRGVNYVIGRRRARPGLLHAAAIRSTGLCASLGIAEHVAALVRDAGVRLGERGPLPPVSAPRAGGALVAAGGCEIGAT